MESDSRLATCVIRAVFEEEIAALGGKIREMSGEAAWLHGRAVLPRVRKLGRSDQFKGGVAIGVVCDRIDVYPYVFRKVCRNGATIARAIQARRVERGEFRDPDMVVGELRETVRACAADEVFEDAMTRIQRLKDLPTSMSLLAQAMRAGESDPKMDEMMVAEVLRRFWRGRDHSAFGLMNAVTSLARDTEDQEQRWRLEELGGAIAYLDTPRRPKPLSAAKRIARTRSLQLV